MRGFNGSTKYYPNGRDKNHRDHKRENSASGIRPMEGKGVHVPSDGRTVTISENEHARLLELASKVGDALPNAPDRPPPETRVSRRTIQMPYEQEEKVSVERDQVVRETTTKQVRTKHTYARRKLFRRGGRVVNALVIRQRPPFICFLGSSSQLSPSQLLPRW